MGFGFVCSLQDERCFLIVKLSSFYLTYNCHYVIFNLHEYVFGSTISMTIHTPSFGTEQWINAEQDWFLREALQKTLILWYKHIEMSVLN